MFLPTIQIDSSRCIHCGKCVQDCLAKILALGPDGIPAFLPDSASRCFRCQHCLSICPVGAFSWSGKKPEDSELPGDLPDPGSMIHLLEQRRSIRSYCRRNVGTPILELIHSVMAFVPTGCNDHRLFFSCSDKMESTDRFRKAASDSVLNRLAAGTLPAKCAHFANLKPALEAGKDIFFRNAPHFAAISVPPESKDAHIDPYIAATQFELLANSFGLGTCWGGMATDLFLSDDHLLKSLKIPEGYELKIMILFGYPDVKYARLPQPEPCSRVAVDGSDL
ncbi:MAG: nitroreductase family protein [Planctomycetia bacterium]|nr:nitroreductase family protein [Planctomycetia bacterium]